MSCSCDVCANNADLMRALDKVVASMVGDVKSVEAEIGNESDEYYSAYVNGRLDAMRKMYCLIGCAIMGCADNYDALSDHFGALVGHLVGFTTMDTAACLQ